MIKCSICTQYFKTEDEKKQHNYIKHPSIICEICGKVFAHAKYLKYHRKMHEPGCADDRNRCPYPNCGKRFTQKSRLEDHLGVHTGAMPYSCEMCSKKFRCRYAKRDHALVCSKTMEFKCNLCDVLFRHRGSLRNHKNAEHSGKKYPCRCGAVFKYQTSLVRHMKEKGHS